MKRLYTTLLAVLFTTVLGTVYGQTSEYFNYQAVIRSSDGSIMQNHEVLIKFTIQSEAGITYFIESQEVVSDAYGVINLSVGEGIIESGTWAEIDWSEELLLLVAIDYDKDGTFDLNGTNLISPVPKANFALKSKVADDLSYPLAGVATSGSYTDLGNKPQLTIEGDSLGLEGSNKVLLPSAGKDSLLLEGTTLSIAGSNSVQLPVGSGNVVVNDASAGSKGIVRLAGDLTGTADAPAIATGAVTNAKVANGINAAKLADGSVSNTELQSLGNVTGDVQAQLDAKANSSSLANIATSGDYGDLQNKPTNLDEDKTDDLLKTDLVNDLTTGGVNQALTAEQGKLLKDALDQKVAIINVYTKTETDNLLLDKVDAETGKGLSTNDYTNGEKALVSGAEQAINKNVANGYAGLDANSKIDVSQLPAITINNVYTVGSETAMLGLSANQGDMAIRTDVSANYVHNGGTSGGIADWTELAFPNIEVTSVNGKTGDVVIGITDISTLQTLLDSKANSADLATVATSGSFSDLTDVPATIDTDATNDVLKSEIVNDLVSGGADKVLSAEQGKVLKTSVDANATDIANNTTSIATNATNISQNTGDIALKEDAANKSTDGTLINNSDVKFPTEKAVKTYVDATVASGAPDATTTTKGKVQLAGDLTGTAAAPEIAAGAVTDTKLAAGIDATKLADGSVSNIELQHLGNVTGDIQAQLDSKASTSSLADVATSGDYADLVNKPVNIDEDKTDDLLKTDLVNDLTTGGVSLVLSAEQGKVLKDALDQKAASANVYTKTEADNLLTGKVNTEAGKGLSENNYTNAEKALVSGAEQTANKNIANGYAGLNANTKIDVSQLPAITINNVYTVGTQADMLALNAVQGDMAIRTDVSQNYVHNGGTSGNMTDWTELAFPNIEVTSVNGKTGDVVVGIADISTLQSVLDSKANSADLANVATSGSFNDLTDVPGNIDTDATNDLLQSDVVNDLTTGGTTKVLSAEQGKVLKTSVDENTSNIADNTTAISTNATGINQNTSDIALKEDAANKSTDGTLISNSDIKFPTEKAVKTYVDATVASGAPDATATTKGKIQLAGDLSGTADAPEIAAGAVTDTKLAAGIDATKLADGSVSNTELQYLNGVTGNVQTQIDANATNIATNASDISANATNIALNATKVALADTAGVLRSEINAANNIGTTLQGELDATQAGSGLESDGTYSANTSTNYIGSASSLSGADNALDAQVKINADSIAINAADIATNTTAVASNTSDISDNTAAIALRATQAALEDTTTAVRSSIDANSANIALNATKVALADTAGVLRSEIDAASTIGTSLQTELDATQTGAGLGAEGTYTANGTANYIGSASSLSGADNALDAQLKINTDSIDVNAADIATNTTAIATNASDISDNVAAIALRATQAALEDTTTAVRSAVDANATNIATNASDISANATNIALNATKVALADTAGVLRSEINAANNIGTTLQGELDATQAGSGLESDGTYSANTSTNYIGSANSLSGADNALDAQLKINTDSITVNAADIATNTTAIATNASDISDNTAAIALRATQAALEDTTTALRSAIDANTANIALNATKVALADTAGVLRSEITAANTIGISLQTELDATQTGAGLGAEGTYTANGTANYIGSAGSLAGADDALDTQVKINADSIDVNAADIATNTTAIATNASDISDNVAAIALRATQAALEDTTTAVRSAVDANATSIVTNASDISANATNIALNATKVALADTAGVLRSEINAANNIGTTLQSELDATQAGSGLETDGTYSANTSANYIGSASSLASADDALDTQVKLNADSITVNAADIATNTTAIATNTSDISDNTAAIALRATQAALNDTAAVLHSEIDANSANIALNATKVALADTAGVLRGEIADANSDVTALQGELDATQSGAGLETDGTYFVNTSANYISSATTLYGADDALDAQLKINADSIAINAAAVETNTTAIASNTSNISDNADAIALRATQAALTDTATAIRGALVDSVAAVRADAFNVNNLTDTYVPYLNGTGLDDSPMKIASGKVGIATTAAPKEALDVNGNINIAENSSLMIGDSTVLKLGSLITSTAVGVKASTSGNNTTSVGYHAGFNSASSYATLLGAEAGQNGSGSQFTGIGISAGANNNGPNSIAIGPYAGDSLTAASAVVIGYQAGQNNSGEASVAIGREAGQNNTGEASVAIGRKAGQGNIGLKQIALGEGAGTDNEGPGQIAIGSSSGIRNKGATSITLGSASGIDNTGNNTLGIGNIALRGNQGDNVIALGYEAGKNNTLNNQFIVKQSQVNSTPLIQGDFLTGNLNIAGKVTAGANATANMDLVPLAQMNDSLAAAGSAITSKLDNTYIPYLSGTELRNSAIKQISSSEVNVVTEVVSTGKFYFDNYGGNPVLRLTRNRGTIASPLATTNGDLLGTLSFSGRTDAGQNQLGAMIKVTQTGDASTAYIPAKFSLFTADGPAYGERLTVLSDGKVGIGTTTPASTLHIKENAGTGLYQLILDNHSLATGDKAGIGFRVSTAPGDSTFIKSAIFFKREIGGIGSLNFAVNNNAISDNVLETDTKMTLTRLGNLGIGVTTPSEKLDVAGNIKGSGTLTIAGNLAMGAGNYINADGADEGLSFDADGKGTFSTDLTVNGNTYFPSDRRLKTNIETLSDVLDKINQIRGVRFEYKDQTKYATGPKIGVIAQELQKVYPELVTEGADGFLKVDYTQLTGILLQAVKEQQKEIDTLKKQMETVMKKLDMN